MSGRQSLPTTGSRECTKYLRLYEQGLKICSKEVRRMGSAQETPSIFGIDAERLCTYVRISGKEEILHEGFLF